jgi:hypothetical protein
LEDGEGKLLDIQGKDYLIRSRTAVITPEGKSISYVYNQNNQVIMIATDTGSNTFTYDSLTKGIKRTLSNLLLSFNQ